jgi:hypothetical protein
MNKRVESRTIKVGATNTYFTRLDDSTKRFFADQLLWIGIYFGIAIIVGIFLDFPLSLIAIIAIIIPLSLFRRRRIMKRMGQQQGSGSFFGGMGGGGMFGSRGGLSYYCISCGTKHNQAECPRCGSRMKKAAFDS